MDWIGSEVGRKKKNQIPLVCVSEKRERNDEINSEWRSVGLDIDLDGW